MAGHAAEGTKKVTVNFASGMEFNMEGTITIPTGIQDISFVGSENAMVSCLN